MALDFQIPEKCMLCPRACGANRKNGQTGVCGASNQLKVARAGLHLWEEPCISGNAGSGTVFFSGCSLKCCYCQNYEISAHCQGKEISVERLADIFLELQSQGAHNINLVTPGQWRPWIISALRQARGRGLTLPIVCNTGGYETVESIRAWAGYVDIWLTDWKYATTQASSHLSAAPDYPFIVQSAVHEMLLQTGSPIYNKDGLLQSGVIIRHLAIPGYIEESLLVLEKLAELKKDFDFIPSLMSQFTPFYKASEHGIGRRITSYEYRKVVNRAMELGLTAGYMQEKSSAKEEYTPAFDCTGV